MEAAQREANAFDDLVARAQLEDRESLDKLAQLAVPRLRAYIYRVALDDQLTEELIQETLSEMVASLPKLRKPESFWAWLLRIASSKTTDFFRRRSRRRELVFSGIDEALLQSSLADSSDSPSERLAHGDVKEELIELGDMLGIRTVLI